MAKGIFTKSILVVTMLLIGFLSAPAQNTDKPKHEPGNEMRKELREFKIKFLAQEIELREDQKAEFTRLYDEMSDEKHKAFSEAMKADRKVRHDKNATEADYEAASKAMVESRRKDAEIERQYDQKFKQILTPKQIYNLKRAEDKFRRRMDQMREQKKNGTKHHKGEPGSK